MRADRRKGGPRPGKKVRGRNTRVDSENRDESILAAARTPFSPFTYTMAAGNGIANPTTLHASWQLVISHPVLRQHTPRYVFTSSPCRCPCRSAFVQEYPPLDSAFRYQLPFLLISLPYSFTRILLLCLFPALFFAGAKKHFLFFFTHRMFSSF